MDPKFQMTFNRVYGIMSEGIGLSLYNLSVHCSLISLLLGTMHSELLTLSLNELQIKMDATQEHVTVMLAAASLVLTGVADATDWTYWSHLETLFRSIPSSSQTVIEDEGDFSDQFLNVEETICGMKLFHFVLLQPPKNINIVASL
jgi:hypothetical protein